MRIIAGRWRGRPLLAPEGRSTRPTSDRAREGLFSMLQSRLGAFDELRVADLFAGSGALGLEALSRGAAHCTFIENDRASLDTLKANIGQLGASAMVRAGGAEAFAGGEFDLVFLDPPYDSRLGQRALETMIAPAGAWASLETARPERVEVMGWAVDTERVYGKAKITLLRRS